MHHPMKELPLVEDYGEKRSGGDEVLRTGDVYYLEPGHVPVFEEDTDVLEFSPKAEYQRIIDVAARNIAAMQGKD